MITAQLIQRINILAKKKKDSGLSPEETSEQAQLRRIYLDTIHGRLKQSLEQIEIVDDPKHAVTIIREKEVSPTLVDDAKINYKH